MAYKLKNNIKTVGKAVGGLIAGAYISTLVGCSGATNRDKYGYVDNKVKNERKIDVYQLGKQKLNLSYKAVNDYINAFKTEIEDKNLNLNPKEQFRIFVDYTSNSKEAYMVVSDEKKEISSEKVKNKLVIRPKDILETKTDFKKYFEKLNEADKLFIYYDNVSRNKRSVDIFRQNIFDSNIFKLDEINKYSHIISELNEIKNYRNNIWRPLSKRLNCTAEDDITYLRSFERIFKNFIEFKEYCTNNNQKKAKKKLNKSDYKRYLNLCNNKKIYFEHLTLDYKKKFGKKSCFKKSIIDKLENKIRSDFYKNKQPVKSIKEQLKKSKKYRR